MHLLCSNNWFLIEEAEQYNSVAKAYCFHLEHKAPTQHTKCTGPYQTTSCKEVMKCFCVWDNFCCCCCSLLSCKLFSTILWHHQTLPLGWIIYLPVQRRFWKQYMLNFVLNSKLWWCPLFPHGTESFTQPGYWHHTASHIPVILCFLLALCLSIREVNQWHENQEGKIPGWVVLTTFLFPLTFLCDSDGKGLSCLLDSTPFTGIS